MAIALPSKTNYRIGLISDTHGVLPEKVAEFFVGLDLVLHAGDIGSEAILTRLEAFAPVIAVRGNMDRGAWASRLRPQERVQAGAIDVLLVHDTLTLQTGDQEEALAVVSGHTHRAHVERKNGVLHINPGSAGSPRHGEPPSIALLTISGAAVQAELLPLTFP